MGYFNGNKVFTVKEVKKPFKHRVKIQATGVQETFIIYADVYSMDNTNWAGQDWQDKTDYWEGFIAGKGGQGDFLFQYMKCGSQTATIYVDYADQSANYETLDIRTLEIISDTVTQS